MEFLVAEKESITNIHKRLEKYTVLLLVAERHELLVLRKAKRSSVTRIVLAGQQQQWFW